MYDVWLYGTIFCGFYDVIITTYHRIVMFENIYNKSKLCVFLLMMLAVLTLSGCNKSGDVPVQMRQAGDKAVHVRIEVADYGGMEFVLLKDAPDEIVKDFTERAKSGFYVGKPVYMVIKDFCIMAGEQTAESVAAAQPRTDDGGKGGDFYPFYGALCITDVSDNVSAEHFTVIGADKGFISELEELLAYKKVTLAEYFDTAYGVKLDEETLELFKEYGGAPWLNGHCRVFGQMTEGFEVLDAISGVPVSDDAQFRPETDIVIDKVFVY